MCVCVCVCVSVCVCECESLHSTSIARKTDTSAERHVYEYIYVCMVVEHRAELSESNTDDLLMIENYLSNIGKMSKNNKLVAKCNVITKSFQKVSFIILNTLVQNYALPVQGFSCYTFLRLDMARIRILDKMKLKLFSKLYFTRL